MLQRRVRYLSLRQGGVLYIDQSINRSIDHQSDQNVLLFKNFLNQCERCNFVSARFCFFSGLTQMQSVSILSDDLCPSMLLFPFVIFLLCFPTVLSGYCNVSFYFLGILGVMKLHHSEVQVCSNCEKRWKNLLTQAEHIISCRLRSAIFICLSAESSKLACFLAYSMTVGRLERTYLR